MAAREKLVFAPLDPTAFHERYILAGTEEPELTLRQLLAEQPSLALQPVQPGLLNLKVTELNLQLAKPGPETPLYIVDGLPLPGLQPAPAETETTSTPTAQAEPDGEPDPDPTATKHPASLGERQAVLIAHAEEIAQAASFLASGLSVLIQCEKLLVEHLSRRIATLSGKPHHRVTVEKAAPGADPLAALGGSRRTELIAGLERAVTGAVPGDIVLIPHLDLLGGGSDATLSVEARELTDLLYEHSDRVLLAFTDPSLVIPEVLANRFAVRISMDILPRELITESGDKVPIGQALVTREEAELFEGFDAHTLYKHVAGMNAVRLRHGLLFAVHEHKASGSTTKPSFEWLLDRLRTFKARNSNAFELPNVPLRNIGGYKDVKRELQKAVDIINGAYKAPDSMPQHMRSELIPRGFIFHGPPGTGKTLFAKAIATSLGGTIQVVSGPEVTDMYVGESERKLRALFAEARRNAPAVLVFDEFDSIAGRRTGRDDGGSRAGNAVVAQLLTELDGFRPEVPVLIIGTTNRIDIIDEALLRPSRFREIKIGYPEEPEVRKQIAKVHAEHFQVDHDDELLDAIARCTNGMNGDEIRSIFRDAKANELVGDHRKPDAVVLGEMIGRIRHGQQEREAVSANGRPGGAGQPRTRNTLMTQMTPRAGSGRDEEEGDSSS